MKTVLLIIVVSVQLLIVAKAQDLTKFVDPLIGSGGLGYGVGSSYVGPAQPFGMVRPGPDTTNGGNHPGFSHCSGYYHRDSQIRGFTHTKMHGTGIADYGNIALMPGIGNPRTMMIEKNRLSKFSHSGETAKPGYYSVFLKTPGIKAELSAGKWTAIHRYTFPKSASSVVVIDAAQFIADGEVKQSWVKTDVSKNEVSGGLTFFGGMTGRAGGITTYFVAQSDTKPRGIGLWKDGTYSTKFISVKGKTSGAVFSYATSSSQKIHWRVGVSFISEAQARKNIQAELPGFNFNLDQQAARTKKLWNQRLATIKIQTTDAKIKTRFYTALYHSQLMPTSFTEAGGVYKGFDHKIHPAGEFEYFTDISLWDTFRTQHPLLNLIAPRVQRDIAMSLLRMKKQGGALPRWPIGTGESSVMIGDSGAIMLVDSWMAGLKGMNEGLLWDSIYQNAFDKNPSWSKSKGRGQALQSYLIHGFVPADLHSGSVSQTLEYAYADAAVAQFAKHRKQKRFSDTLLARSEKAIGSIWHPERQFFVGKNKNLSWVPEEPDRVWSRNLTEGTPWQWAWMVPQDPDFLIRLMGGREKFLSRLDEFFEKSHKHPKTLAQDPYYWHGNEPDIHAAFLYNAAFRPDRMSEEVRWILNKRYNNTPAGLDGNDDAGTLSAWFVFASVGIYPIPATSRFYLSTPTITNSVINLGNGKMLEISAPETSSDNKYIQHATWNGKALQEPWISQKEIMNGGKLYFQMTASKGSYF